MAKGVEDTAFYRYVRLLALNEVGGDPGRFGIDVEAFHAANIERARRFPHALLAGTTHDTKRSADVRARIGTLSNIPERWAENALRWRELNRPLRQGAAPDWTEELLIYQTLLGAWPLSAERLSSYMQKALLRGEAPLELGRARRAAGIRSVAQLLPRDLRQRAVHVRLRAVRPGGRRSPANGPPPASSSCG